MTDRVLLTGISGFLGGHVALQLLNSGYTVRGSVRNLSRADKVRDTLLRHGADVSRLEFVALDLMRDAGWDEAMEGVRYLQHTASPFLIQIPKDKMELIGPAVEGTERALNAANNAGVERIVLTSSMAAIAYGHDKSRTTPFTAKDWTDLNGRAVNFYQESKTFGPLLDDDPGTSAVIVQRLLDGSIPAAPRIPMTIIDVRDIAAAHVAAMTAPDAGGKRFPMGERTVFFLEAAKILRERYPERRIPSFGMPDWAVRLYALFDRDMRDNMGELGYIKRLDSSDAISLLGRPLLTAPEALLATAESLVSQRLV
ncbi:MAG: NAD-dependent epimerase/dehydratase family protein [Rhizobiaceae bacterium]|nr:MAG: NAD-dependent epimerase/dehydratase family protein [Rhizobiaceae bacterium]